jgi:hypothetical protein
MRKYKTSPWLLPHMVPFFYIALLLGLYPIHIITFPSKGFCGIVLQSHQHTCILTKELLGTSFWNKVFWRFVHDFAQRKISHQCISTSMPTCSHATSRSVIVARCGGRRRVFFFPSCVWCAEWTVHCSLSTLISRLSMQVFIFCFWGWEGVSMQRVPRFLMCLSKSSQ